jgi:hypothetical protein
LGSFESGVDAVEMEAVGSLGAVEGTGAAESGGGAGGDLVVWAGEFEPEGGGEGGGVGAFLFVEGGVAAAPAGVALEAHLLVGFYLRCGCVGLAFDCFRRCGNSCLFFLDVVVVVVICFADKRVLNASDWMLLSIFEHHRFMDML